MTDEAAEGRQDALSRCRRRFQPVGRSLGLFLELDQEEAIVFMENNLTPVQGA
jgi:hypothetical protein